MPARAVVVLAPAETDIDHAIAYLDQQRPGLGRIFLDNIHDAIRRIRDHPELYQCFRGDCRRAVERRFGYAVVYRAVSQKIEVIAVLSCRRNPAVAVQRAIRSAHE